ncbi:SGNH hydrolase domain-containing protein, partial [Bradyrhizobium sp.]|uniref:SGNH hydrolase domain-containing protein n=1 Tax=Bradyrhizobium sp. TaxID=376 RepID=UPI0023861846
EIRPVLAMMQYDPASNARADKCWLRAGQTFGDYASECSSGALLIWGDSHAARLYAGLARQGNDIAQFTRDGCPPSAAGPYQNCAESNAAILRRIAELKPRRIILAAAWANHERYLQPEVRDEGLMAALMELRDTVEDIIVIGQGPLWSPDMPTQVYESWRANGKLPDRLRPMALPYRRINEALAAMSAAAGARFVSPFDALCNEQGCLTHTPASKAELLSWDYGHSTLAGARYLGGLLHLD